MDYIPGANIWIGLVTLTVLEIVLGIDNIVFISILSGKLPEEQRRAGRRVGLVLALVTRILLLLGLSWVISLTAPLFYVMKHSVSGRDLILIVGGLFLLAKSTHEIHHRLEKDDEGPVTTGSAKFPSFASIVIQIGLLDIVFSLDSVITAVGMIVTPEATAVERRQQIVVMVAAVVIAVIFMLFFVNAVSDFVDRHPTIKMLALAFLILIGANLVAEGLHQPIPKGYTYFAMAFSVMVEMLNIRTHRKASPQQAGH